MRIGITGFGRIGKLVFRIIEEYRLNGHKDMTVVAINCPSVTSENLEYLMNYDTVHSLSKFNIETKPNSVIVNGNHIQLFRERSPTQIAWDSVSVDCIIECTGAFKTLEKAKQHLKPGVKTIIISAPSPDIPMLVMGVNHESYRSTMNIVSNSSCTTNCLAPVAKVIHDNFGIEEGFLSTIHSITSSQNTLDGRASKNIRIGRSSQNIIPSTTGATKALGVVIPELQNKITGMSYRVPTNNVSVIDFSFRTVASTTYEDILRALQHASANSMFGIMRCSEKELVSSDFIGDSHSAIIDVKLGQQIGQRFFKVVAWYDNEWGYSHRIVDLLKYIDSKKN